MDLVAEMLLESLQRGHADEIAAVRVCPAMRYRFARNGGDGAAPAGAALRLARLSFNADRALNRFYDYPRLLRRTRGSFDLFHVVDHAYSQLVHHLPAERTVVTCHDLHTFQCILDPSRQVRSAAFRWMTSHILRGMSKAARIVVDTAAVRDELIAHAIVPPERIAVVHLGVHPAFSARPDPRADDEALRLLQGNGRNPAYLLHVGGTFARKRIDLLLRIFARVRRERPDARLIRVGGPMTGEQVRLMRELGLEDALVPLPFVERDVLAAIYRQAALVAIPSEVEGFGLPVVEAMTCGTPVVASDLPVLREVGGEAAEFCPVGDVDRWADRILGLLSEREEATARWAERQEAGFQQAGRFTWPDYAKNMVDVYQGVLEQ
jgi:glycosyltransferase involved in cell wall biosynthesis